MLSTFALYILFLIIRIAALKLAIDLLSNSDLKFLDSCSPMFSNAALIIEICCLSCSVFAVFRELLSNAL